MFLLVQILYTKGIITSGLDESLANAGILIRLHNITCGKFINTVALVPGEPYTTLN